MVSSTSQDGQSIRRGLFYILLAGVTVEPNDELDRAVTGTTTAANAGNLGFPIGLFLIKTTGSFPTLRDRRPGLARARHIGNEAAGGNRNLAMLRGLAFCHPEAASLFRGGGKVRWCLGSRVRGLIQEIAQQYEPEDRQHKR